MLSGIACSHVFDGIQVLGESSSQNHAFSLRGIEVQPDIGFLSFLEHYQSYTVGGCNKEMDL